MVDFLGYLFGFILGLFLTYIYCNGSLYTHMLCCCKLCKKEEKRKGVCKLWQCPATSICPYSEEYLDKNIYGKK